MNIKIEKKKYTPPFMEIVMMAENTGLLRGSLCDDDDECEELQDIEDFEDGYDDEFG
jgi:hypothetical protein